MLSSQGGNLCGRTMAGCARGSCAVGEGQHQRTSFEKNTENAKNMARRMVVGNPNRVRTIRPHGPKGHGAAWPGAKAIPQRLLLHRARRILHQDNVLYTIASDPPVWGRSQGTTGVLWLRGKATLSASPKAPNQLQYSHTPAPWRITPHPRVEWPARERGQSYSEVWQIAAWKHPKRITSGFFSVILWKDLLGQKVVVHLLSLFPLEMAPYQNPCFN